MLGRKMRFYHSFLTNLNIPIYIFEIEVAFPFLVRAMVFLNLYIWQGLACHNFNFFVTFVVQKFG